MSKLASWIPGFVVCNEPYRTMVTPIFQTRRGITRYAQKHYAEPEYSDSKTLEKKDLAPS